MTCSAFTGKAIGGVAVFVVVLAAALSYGTPSHAQTLTWSGTGSFLGPGTWSSANTNWWNGTADQTWTAGNTAAFGVSTGTGSTVTVSGSQSVSGIVFNPLSVSANTAGAIFTLTGGTIGIGSGNSILASGTLGSVRNGLHTITSAVVGENLSIGRAPGGSTSATANVGVVLNGTNNLTGTLTVGGTTILLANASAVNGVSTIDVQAASTFGANVTGTYNSNIQLAAGSNLTTNVGAGTFTGTVALFGNSANFSGNGGPANVLQGPIIDSSGGTAKTLNLTKRGILEFTGSSTFSGTYVLNGVNAAYGATTILNGGDNRLPADSSFSILAGNQVLILGTSAAVDQTFANLSSSTAGVTSSVQGGAASTSTLTVNLATGTNIFYGSLGGSSYMDGSVNTGAQIKSNPNGNNLAFIKSGGGTFVLAGSSSYIGGTQLNGGVLALSNTGALGTSGTVSFGGGTIQFSGSNQVDYSSRFSTATNQAYSLDTNGQTVSLATALTSVGGSLTKLGTGTLASTAANTFDGGTVISNGALVLDGGDNRLLSTGAVTIGSSGAAGRLVLGSASTVSQTVGSLVTTGSGGSVVGGNVATSTLIVDQASGAGTFAGSLGGAGTNENNLAFEKRGAGALTLSGSNSLVGGMTLTAGQLNINNANALGGAANVFTIAGGTLGNTSGGSIAVAGNNAHNWNGDFTFVGSNPLNLGTGAVTLGASRQVTITSSTLTVGGGIAGSGFGLTKVGNGTLSLTGSNTFGGGVTLNAGTIMLGNANALGTGTLTAGGGSLNSSSLGTATISNAITVNAPLTVTYGGQNTYSGALTGASDISFTGENVVFLNQNVANYNGTIVISASTATNYVRIANSTSGTTWQTQKIDLQGNTVAARAGLNGTQRLGAVSGAAGTVLATGNGAVTYDVGYANTDATFAGRITDATSGTTVTSIQKSGAGTWTLSGSNSYTGATTVSSGRLHIAPTGSLNSTSGITINGGELKYNAAIALSAPITFTAGTLSGTGTIGSAVTVATNDVLSPGNSPGTQSYSAGLAWAPGGTYQWELEALTGAAGTTWDLIDITSGAFSLATLGTAEANRFTLDLTTLGAGGASGPLASGYDGGSYAFLIAGFSGATLTVPGGFSTAAGSDLTPLFSLNLANWQAPKPDIGNISVRVNSGGTGLELIIVPEPGAVALAGIGVCLTGWTMLKRRRMG